MHVLATRKLIGAILGGATLMASTTPLFANELWFFVKSDNKAMSNEFRTQLFTQESARFKEVCTEFKNRKTFASTVIETPPKKSKHFYDPKFTKRKYQLGFKCTPRESGDGFSSPEVIKRFTDVLLNTRNVKGDRDGTITIMAPSGTCIPQDCAGLGYAELRDKECIPC